jgi:hypothetical protein
MLPFIGRPWKTKTRTQSSEHGVVATGTAWAMAATLYRLTENSTHLLKTTTVATNFVLAKSGALATYIR